ncbi:hypothetical protein AWENTII_002063 [Aspergillus wentii]
MTEVDITGISNDEAQVILARRFPRATAPDGPVSIPSIVKCIRWQSRGVAEAGCGEEMVDEFCLGTDR